MINSVLSSIFFIIYYTFPRIIEGKKEEEKQNESMWKYDQQRITYNTLKSLTPGEYFNKSLNRFSSRGYRSSPRQCRKRKHV